MTILRNVFIIFCLAVGICIMMSGCTLLAIAEKLLSGPPEIDVKERMEMLTLDYDCKPISYDEEIDGRREKHHLHIECQPIKQP